MNEERMRDLYARHTALRAATDPPCQVSLDAMIDVLQHRGSEEERRQVMGEILRNPACREEFELLRAVVRASEPFQAEVDSPPGVRKPFLTPVQWRVAAGIVLLVGIGLAGLIARRGPRDQLRGGNSGIPMYDPRDEAQVHGLPRFVWGSMAGAIDYRFQLLNESGQVVYSMTGTDTVLQVPSDAAVPAGRYLWNVTVQMPGGVAINSPTRGLVVAP
jgi:hypothetical protein